MYVLSVKQLHHLYSVWFNIFLQTAQCTLRLTDFMSKASQLYTRMITKGGHKGSILRHMK